MFPGRCKKQHYENTHRHEISLTSEDLDEVTTPSYSQDTSTNSLNTTSSSELRLQCHICSKKFHKKIHLAKHLNIHDEARPLKCESCGKRFNLMWHLKRHKLVHSKIKPFSCSHCEKSFCTKCELTRHTNYSHYGIKEYTCDNCNKSFTLKSNLKVHQRKHTGEKPYKCSICEQAFYQSGHLTYHLKKHAANRDNTEIYPTVYSMYKNEVNVESPPLTVHTSSNYDIPMQTKPQIYSYYKSKIPFVRNLGSYTRNQKQADMINVSADYLHRIRFYYANYHKHSTPVETTERNSGAIWRPFTED